MMDVVEYKKVKKILLGRGPSFIENSIVNRIEAFVSFCSLGRRFQPNKGLNKSRIIASGMISLMLNEAVWRKRKTYY